MARSGVNGIDRWVVKQMLSAVGNPPVKIILWNGEAVSNPAGTPLATLTYKDRAALLKSLLNPELHWGDLYSQGRIGFEGDLVQFLCTIYLGIRANLDKSNVLKKFLVWLGNRRIFNTIEKARENIHHHYDIGNEFYKLWLDTEEMQYTCAYFDEPTMTLEQAQVAKLHHVCKKLDLKPGETVVEAGCGWGGLARFMARNYGVKVKAYNISVEQVKYAREEAERQGLGEQIEYVLDDYRNIKGKFDAFVSIGMLEHVGPPAYEELGRVASNALKPEGRGLIHSIGRYKPGPMNAWIERRIFPGAYPPSLAEFMQIFEPNDLVPYDIENLRLHYSETLHAWDERFHAHKDEISNMFDAEFIRAWGLYLAGSIAAFDAGSLQLYQVVFTHNINNDVPRNRRHLYEDHHALMFGDEQQQDVGNAAAPRSASPAETTRQIKETTQ